MGHHPAPGRPQEGFRPRPDHRSLRRLRRATSTTRSGGSLQHLEACGLADNTIVVIYSDHGMEFFEHDTWGQGNSVRGDASAKIPLLIVDPRRPGGGTCADASCARSISRRHCSTCVGQPVPDQMDGVSLEPYLDGAGMGLELRRSTRPASGSPTSRGCRRTICAIRISSSCSRCPTSGRARSRSSPSSGHRREAQGPHDPARRVETHLPAATNGRATRCTTSRAIRTACTMSPPSIRRSLRTWKPGYIGGWAQSGRYGGSRQKHTDVLQT